MMLYTTAEVVKMHIVHFTVVFCQRNYDYHASIQAFQIAYKQIMWKSGLEKEHVLKERGTR
jgi:hypothetical protein